MDGAATVIHQSLALPYSSIHSYSETSETLKFTEKVILNRQTHTGRSLLEILQLVFAYLPQAAMTYWTQHVEMLHNFFLWISSVKATA